MRKANVVIVGAPGLVGLQIARVLEDHRDRFSVGKVRLVASGRSAGQQLTVLGAVRPVEALTEDVFGGMDFAFFATPNDVSAKFAPVAAAAGSVAIDKSSHFRMQEDVPLVVPEVNPHAIGPETRVIASPNCSTIQLVMALAPLERAAGIARVIVSTYQSVSGSGREALEGLEAEARAYAIGEEITPQSYAQPIHMNVLAQCDAFMPDGFTKEEQKLRLETRKIFSRPDLPLAATAVRVPVRIGHSEAVTVELRRPMDAAEARSLLSAQPGVKVLDDPAQQVYPTARMAEGIDDVLVGRVRQDPDRADTLHLFVVADNLRKGAATNAVQIAEVIWKAQE
ncbi:MAG: aspartate-semialdehyde dehydrogenase [Thermaerobacter sp.]|nr:aspartate-semialdehyde dehydrogenase [Thermaerobacter sp.]